MASLGGLAVVKAGLRVPKDEEGQAASLLGDSSRQLHSLSPASPCKEVTTEPEKQRAGLPVWLSLPRRPLLGAPWAARVAAE